MNTRVSFRRCLGNLSGKALNRLVRYSLVSTASLVLSLVTTSQAVEVSTGPLTLQQTRIKTVGAPGEVITIPTCPTQTKLFTSTTIASTSANFTIEIATVSEISDVTPGADSIRFFATVDGSAVGVIPNSNAGVNSTAKSGQIETATMTWARRLLAAGSHTVDVKACVNDTTPGGGASAFAGDRTLVIRSYQGS